MTGSEESRARYKNFILFLLSLEPIVSADTLDTEEI